MSNSTDVQDKHIVDFFDALAVERDRHIEEDPWVAFEQTQRHLAVARLAGIGAGESVLDVGCANARDMVSLGLSHPDSEFLGIDLSPVMIDEAARIIADNGLSNASAQIGSATNLPLPNDSFDCVICSEVIEHVPDYQAVIHQIARVLRPGGRAVLTTPNRHSWYGMDKHILEGVRKIRGKNMPHPHDEWKTKRELLRALIVAGLRPTTVTGACYLPGFLLAGRLPTALTRLIVSATKRTEPVQRTLFPSWGYMLAVRAAKPER